MSASFNQLRYFCVLAETLHFGRAANRLRISQPPLSRQIALLEAKLGTALFERNTKCVVLTSAGRQLFQDAKEVLRLTEQATRNVTATSRGEKGALTLGFTMCAAYNVVPLLTARYMAEFPEVTLTVREMLPNMLEAELKDGAIDFAITFPGLGAAGIKQQTLLREPMNLVVPQSHRLADAKRIKGSDLVEERFVLVPREQAAHLYDGIIRHCQADGFMPKVALEVYLQQTIVNFVAAGLGIAFVPESMRRAQVQGAVFKTVTDPPMVEQTLFWSAANRNPCMAGFLDVTKHLANGDEASAHKRSA